MQIPLYFAYGSNMLQKRLEARVGTVEKLCTLEIPGLKLIFDWAGVGVLTEGEFVEGVLYRLTPRQIYELDWYEGNPRIYEKRYFTHKGQICFLYNKVDIGETQAKPFLSYLNYIIEGAIENDLQKTLKKLIAFKNANFKLPRGSKHKI